MLTNLEERPGNTLHLFVLSAFAIAQPLFDLLSRNPEFFAARQTQPDQILALALTILFALPAVLVLILWLCGLVSAKLRTTVHGFQIVLLVATIALPLLKDIPGITPPFIFLAAAICGIGFLALYIRLSSTRALVSFLGVAIVVFPAHFLLMSPVSKLLFPDKGSTVAPMTIGNPVSIVLVVLDELPTVSLMNENRSIDPVRYPNFAAIAATSTWYRNATTVGPDTLLSLPAILTGKLPKHGSALPNATNFPENLFTALSNSHQLNVFESITSLCPKDLCKRVKSGSREQFGNLLSDLAVVYLHIILPTDITTGLPDISQNWGNFIANAAGHADGASGDINWLKDIVGPWQQSHDRAAFFRQFSSSIEQFENPALHFLHVPLPHTPFAYLPSGKTYKRRIWEKSTENGKREKMWVHEWAAAQSYQRSLLQLAYVDSLIGELVEDIKMSGAWDESLVIIVSDHGASYKVNHGHRVLSSDNYMDIMPVLLLIKYPRQETSSISDRNVETVDIVPTIADVMDAKLPYDTDGDSLLDLSIAERTRKGAFSKAEDAMVYFDATMAKMYDSLADKIALLGSGDMPIVLQGIGLRSELLGKRVSVDTKPGRKDIHVTLDYARKYSNVNPDDDFLPVRVTGRVKLTEGKLQTLDIAVAINGVIQGVGQTYPIENANEFSIIVPENSLSPGNNKVSVFVPKENAVQSLDPSN